MKEDFFDKLSRNYDYNQLRMDKILEGTIEKHVRGIDATSNAYHVALLAATQELQGNPDYNEYRLKAQALLELAVACDYGVPLINLYNAYKLRDGRL